jgi:hypothetical protein
LNNAVFTYFTNFEDIKQIEQLDDFDNEEVYDLEVDDNSHTFIGNDILVHNSVYTTYGTLFNCFTPESLAKYDTDRKKVDWMLKFNTEFLDKQNTAWLDEMYGPRHGKNIHLFELETISRVQINLTKKKYLKAYAFSKGKFLDPYKIAGTGIEIIKSTTPKLCRTILTELTKDLMFNSVQMGKEEYILYFRNKLEQYKKQFYSAPIEDISNSVNVGAYNKFVIDDKENLTLDKGTPLSVKAIAFYNHLAHKNGEDSRRTIAGKIKYYNIRLTPKQTSYFGFPSGELPDWAPKMDKKVQWQKNIIDPINRFLEVMAYPLMNADGVQQGDLFAGMF